MEPYLTATSRLEPSLMLFVHLWITRTKSWSVGTQSKISRNTDHSRGFLLILRWSWVCRYRYVLRILFHQGSYKDKRRKVVSWFSLRQDVSETLLKKWGHRYIVWKKWSGEVKKIHVLLWWSGIMAQIISFFFVFEVGRINSSSS